MPEQRASVCLNLGAAVYYLADQLGIDIHEIGIALADKRLLRLPRMSFSTPKLDEAMATINIGCPPLDTIIQILQTTAGCPSIDCSVCPAKNYAEGIFCPMGFSDVS